MKRFFLSVFLIISTMQAGARCEVEGKTVDFSREIKDYDLSLVLAADTVLWEEEEAGERPEILGFIGDDYQRFRIHFVSMIKSPADPYLYYVYGKTKVKNNICSFIGEIRVTKAEICESFVSAFHMEGDVLSEVSGYREGDVVSDVVLYEDNKQSGSGIYRGTLVSSFLIDPSGAFRYNALWSVADGFCNNQCIGTWTSHATGVTKKCNWGDFRIPGSMSLDSGAGEFIVDEDYLKNGWEGYQEEWNVKNVWW